MTKKSNLIIVGIGASAGGLDAVKQLISGIPSNTGMSFVIIQHLSPDFKSLMPELLAKHTKMKIFTAEENLEIKPNCIYLNERTKNLELKGNKLVLLSKAPKGNLNLPIDIFFHTLGKEHQENTYGIILSGTGSDGSRGINTIKEAGGTILVQEPSSAQFDGMPNSAISTNLADFILPPAEIAQKIIQLNSKRISILSSSSTTNNHEDVYQDILELIYKDNGVNFKKYKNNTLLRRLEKRMSIHSMDTLKEYYSLIAQNPKERKIVYQEFLINVTNFFRDTEAFDVIKKTVIPKLIDVNTKSKNIRIWVAGASTGEEVYSLAILIDNYIRINKLNFNFKIFATDIDKDAIQVASLGSYSVNNIVDIKESYLKKYFLKHGDKIHIIKRIREKIVFSYHDVTKDPPFIRMDLISCRNLLIYFNSSTQQKVLSNFQYSLNKSAFLFLGSSESLGSVSNHFEVIDNKWKIYRNLTENNRLGSEEDFENEPSAGLRYLKENHNSKLLEDKNQEMKEVDFYKFLSKRNSPTSVFIDKNYDIIFVVGNLKEWFSIPDGFFQNNLLKITKDDLAAIIRNGVRRTTKEGKNVIYKDLVLYSENETRNFDLSFEKISRFENYTDIYLIEFKNLSNNSSTAKIVLSDTDLPNFSKQRIDDLEFELKVNKSELQNVVEELETSNEELQSSNEELMSSNEELQSSNEELQSVNEELYTVNTELQEKNKELEELSNDVTNLLNSSDIGTLFLDTELNIRKFTPVIKRVFNLEDSDIGRSIKSFASEFDENERKSLIINCKESLENLKSFEREIQDNDGSWYLIRINPFVTSTKKISGVVIALIDFNEVKKAQAKLRDSNNRLDIALKNGNMAWWELRLPEGTVVFSDKKTEMLGLNSEDFKTYSDFTKIVNPDDYENTMQAFRDHLTGKKDTYDCQYRIKDVNGNYKWFKDVGKISQKDGENILITGIVIDITQIKEAEQRLIEAQQKAETANIYKNQFLANMSHEIRTPMNGLVGFASLLRNDVIDIEKRNKYIDIIQNSSSQLLKLINDIIDVSKIEAKELKIEIVSCKISELFFNTEITFNELKRKKNKDHIKITAHVPEKVKDIIIQTDANRLQQVLTNLVENALKFTEKGSIEFGYTVKQNKVFVYVKDTGIGIPENKIDVIFDRFSQVKQKKGKHNEGTGLGLSISKGVIRLLGGDLQVKSKKSVGTTFSFEIPFVSGAIQQKKPRNQNKSKIEDWLKNKTILVVEDEEVNIEYFKALFENSIAKIIYATNGKMAVEKVESGEKIDIILMDIRMPIMNGADAAKKILLNFPKTKIIAQTAYAMSNDKAKFLKSGFVDYISKPLNKKELLDKLATHLNN
ncbi:CheR family methyltransferase [uncultured Sunxiuqinia sp.]|uniref:CheR family methyltransferase n=1 Tax=uncultured Sunxiuqinia sp. TaxID=1573825 RepID=UPI002AA8BF8F|nr:CheR family methyltransferase [uncultured Sunxiuqinia sp.]